MDSPILEKSLRFAARIVKLHQYLVKEKKESVISKPIISKDLMENQCSMTALR